MKTESTQEAERRQIHVNKMPEWMYKRLQEICANEGRTNRNVGLLFIHTALLHMDKMGCKSLSEYMQKLGVTSIDKPKSESDTINDSAAYENI